MWAFPDRDRRLKQFPCLGRPTPGSGAPADVQTQTGHRQALQQSGRSALPWEPGLRGSPARPAGWRRWPVNTSTRVQGTWWLGGRAAWRDSSVPGGSQGYWRSCKEPSWLRGARHLSTHSASGIWAFAGVLWTERWLALGRPEGARHSSRSDGWGAGFRELGLQQLTQDPSLLPRRQQSDSPTTPPRPSDTC